MAHTGVTNEDVAKGSTLEQLASMTTVICDSGDFGSTQKYKSTDATTNPSFIRAVAGTSEYIKLSGEAVLFGEDNANTPRGEVLIAFDQVSIQLGLDTLKIVPGRVSTEVDPRFSFDLEALVNEGNHLIGLYKEAGTSSDRVLNGLTSIWEGIHAAKIVEKEHGIHCNMMLLFFLPQAVACAEALVSSVSFFVEWILDWHVAHTDKKSYELLGEQDTLQSLLLLSRVWQCVF